MAALASAVPLGVPGVGDSHSGGGLASSAAPVPVAVRFAKVVRAQAVIGAPAIDDWAGIPLLCRLPEAVEDDAFGDQGAGILIRTVQRVALKDEGDTLSW